MSYKWEIKNALREDRGSTTYQIAARTNLPSSVVSRALSKMYLAGEIERGEVGGAALAYFEYFKKADKPRKPVEKAHPASTFNKQDTESVKHRVVMLKRMRDRLIEEYHPLLNAVITDYESFLGVKKELETDEDD